MESSTTETAIDIGEVRAEAESENQSKVITVPRVLVLLSAAFVIYGSLVQQLDTGKHRVYWTMMSLAIISCILWLVAMVQFYSRAKTRRVGLRCPRPGRWWPLFHKKMPSASYMGDPYELLGLLFSFVQTIAFAIAYGYVQSGGVNPLHFSLMPMAFTLVTLWKSFAPKKFQTVFTVVTKCRGVEHAYRARASKNKIISECTCHQQEESNHRGALPQHEGGTIPQEEEMDRVEGAIDAKNVVDQGRDLQ